jgi:hypothetical protein
MSGSARLVDQAKKMVIQRPHVVPVHFFLLFRSAHAKIGKKAPKNSMTQEGKCTEVAI